MPDDTSDQIEHTERELHRAEWGVILSLLVSAATAIFAGGVVYGQVQSQDARLVKVETKSETLTSLVGDQAVTIARIDANVSFLTDAAKEQRGQRK